jgi:anaerobic dimethyl sulfoxide reductase subunit A
MSSVPVFCGKDCGGTACPLLAVVENGTVTRITHNPAGGRYLRGCPRGFNLPLEQYAPNRILTPLVRTGPRGSGQFREASWEEALGITTERLSEIRTSHGAESILSLSGAGTVSALHATYALLGRFLNLFGGCTRLTGSYSNGAAIFVLPYLLGDGWKTSGFDAATMQYSEMIVLWGANALEARLGTELPQRLLEAKARGAEIVVIDPRRSTTVKRAATWHLPCRPGTDAALMLAVLHVLVTEGLVDRPFVASYSTGFERLERYVLGTETGQPRSAEWAAPICGLPASEIRGFARAYGAAKPAMLLPGYSIQRVYAGEETYRLAVALQVATGNFGRRGGSTGSLNNRLPGPRVGSLPVPDVPDLPAVPALRWPDAVLHGRAGGYPSDIHAIYNLGANAVNQNGDVRKCIAAFDSVAFAICHELFLTPTARQCDVVLPAAGPLEKEDIGRPWAGNYLLYRPQVVSPRGAARTDYDILCDLAGRLGFLPGFSEGRTAAEWIAHFIEQSEIPDAGEFRDTGVYLAPDQERVGLADFVADPAGHPLTTPSGKVELASERYQRDTGQPAIPTCQPRPADGRYTLRLISPKPANRTHSQGSSIAAIQAQAPHTLTIHPDDAAARGIGEADQVRIFNAQGVSQVPAHLSEDIVPGVVSLPEGVWAALDAAGIDQAGSANMLTATDGTVPSQSPIMHGVPVEVTRA